MQFTEDVSMIMNGLEQISQKTNEILQLTALIEEYKIKMTEAHK